MRTAMLLVVLAGTVAPAVADCPVKIFFGNGIDTPKDRAAEIVPILRAHVNVEMLRRGLPRIDESCFDLAYATDKGKLQGIVNTGVQLLQDDSTRFWMIMAGLESGGAVFQAGMQAKLSQSIDVQLDNPATGADLRKQLAQYSTAIGVSGLKVIVVAHSQGNAFANSAFDILVSGFDQQPSRDPSTFSITAVATAASYVATGDQYTTLYGDIILADPLALRANTTVEGTPCQPVFGFEQLPGLNAEACHDFVNSYLAGLYSEPRIISQVVDAIPTLPPPPPPPGGTPIQLPVTIAPDGTVTFSCPTGYSVIGYESLKGPYPDTSVHTTTNTLGPALSCGAVGANGYTMESGYLNGTVQTPDGLYWVRISKNGTQYVNTDFSAEWYYWRAQRVNGVWSVVGTPALGMSVTPDSGGPGLVFNYTARGFAGASTVHLKRPNGTESPSVPATPSSTGLFTGTIDTAGFALGAYEVWAVEDGTGRSSPHAIFNVVSIGTPIQLPVTIAPDGTVFFSCPTGYSVIGFESLKGPYPDTSVHTSTNTLGPALSCSAIGSGSYTMENGYLNGTVQTPDGLYWVRISKNGTAYVNTDFSGEWYYWTARRSGGVWSAGIVSSFVGPAAAEFLTDVDTTIGGGILHDVTVKVTRQAAVSVFAICSFLNGTINGGANAVRDTPYGVVDSMTGPAGANGQYLQDGVWTIYSSNGGSCSDASATFEGSFTVLSGSVFTN